MVGEDVAITVEGELHRKEARYRGEVTGTAPLNAETFRRR